MADQEGSVTVLDKDSRFLEWTHPAVARRLLKEGNAVIWSREPFAIRLTRSVDQPNYTRRAQMSMVNFMEFFKEEKDVYVQNVSGMQISISFEVGVGRSESYLFSSDSRPVNLTQYIPFDSIKRSIDFRKLVTRRPATLVLVNDGEYKQYYTKVAEAEGLFVKDAKGKKIPDIEAAINKVEDEHRAVLNREPLPNTRPPEPIHEVVEDDPRMGGHKVVRTAELTSEDIINPRVLHICNQVKNEIPENERMPAAELLRELKGIASQLKLDDWEYVRAHGYYASVKKYAKTEGAKVAESDSSSERDG